jgi:hypothetical protein
MKKILKIVLPLIVVIGLVIFLCIKVGIIANQKERFFYNKLESFINSNKTEIPLKELTNFEWDYVVIGEEKTKNDHFDNYKLYYDVVSFYNDDKLAKKINTSDLNSKKCCIYFVNEKFPNEQKIIVGNNILLKKYPETNTKLFQDLENLPTYYKILFIK